MRTLSSLFALLVLSSALWAQGDGPDCDFCMQLQDASCSESVQCQISAGCVTQNFSVNCEGNYNLYVRMKCTTGTGCEYCQACAYVFEGTQNVAQDHSTCPASCDGHNSFSAHLVPGHTYTLYVCKIPCPGQGYDCDDCSTNCEARAMLVYPGSLCQWVP